MARPGGRQEPRWARAAGLARCRIQGRPRPPVWLRARQLSAPEGGLSWQRAPTPLVSCCWLLLLLLLLPVPTLAGRREQPAPLNNGAASEQLTTGSAVLDSWPNEAALSVTAAHHADPEEAREQVEADAEQRQRPAPGDDDEDQDDDYNDYGAYIIYDTASSSPGTSEAASGVMQAAPGERAAALVFFAATPAPRAPPPQAREQVAAKMDHAANQSAAAGAFKAVRAPHRYAGQPLAAGASGSIAQAPAHQPGPSRQDQSSGGGGEIRGRAAGGQEPARAGRARRQPASLAAGPWTLEAPPPPPPPPPHQPHQPHDIKWLSKMNGGRAEAGAPQSSGEQTAAPRAPARRTGPIDRPAKGDYIGAPPPQHMLPPPLNLSAANQASGSRQPRQQQQPANLGRPHHGPAPANHGAHGVTTWISDGHRLFVTQPAAGHSGRRAAALTLAGEPPKPHNVYYWRLIWFILPLGATFGNLLVIIAVYLERSLQSVTNYFIVSLAFADLFVGLIVMPFAVYVLVNEVWELSDTICDIFVAVDVTSSTASILNLVAISIDRYRAVAYPIAYTTSSSSTIAVLTICGVWLISSAVGTPIIFGLNTTPGRRSDLCILYNSTFIFWSSLASFYIPCIVMIALYWRVFSAIRSRTKKALQAAEYKANPSANQQHRKQAATIQCPPARQEQQQHKLGPGGSLPLPATSPTIQAATQPLPSPLSATQKSNSSPVSKPATSTPQPDPLHQAAHSPSKRKKLSANATGSPKCPLARIQADWPASAMDPSLLSGNWQLAIEQVATCDCVEPSGSSTEEACSRDFLAKLTSGLIRGRNTDDELVPAQLAQIGALMGALSRFTSTAPDTSKPALLKANSSTVSLAHKVLSVSLEFSAPGCQDASSSSSSPSPKADLNSKEPHKKLLEKLVLPEGPFEVLLRDHCQLHTSPEPRLAPEQEQEGGEAVQQDHPEQILCSCCQRAATLASGPRAGEAAPVPPPATLCLLEPLASAPDPPNEWLPLNLNKITLLSRREQASTKQALMMIAYLGLNLELEQDTSLVICIHRWPASKCDDQGRDTFKCRPALGSQLCSTCLASCSLCSLLLLSGSKSSEPQPATLAPISDESPLKEAEKCVHLSRLLKVERCMPRQQLQPSAAHCEPPTSNNSQDHDQVSSDYQDQVDAQVECAGRHAVSSNSSSSSSQASSPSPSASSASASCSPPSPGASSSSSTNFRFGSDFYSGSSTNQPNCHVHHRIQGSGGCCSVDPQQAADGREPQPVLCASCIQQQQQQPEPQLAPSGDHNLGASHSDGQLEAVASLPADSQAAHQKARFQTSAEPAGPRAHRRAPRLSSRQPTGGQPLSGPTGKQEQASRLASQQQAANLLQNATRTIKRRSMRLTQLIRGKRSGKLDNNKEQVESFSTSDATNSDAEELFSSSVAHFGGSSALAARSATLLSSQSTDPTTGPMAGPVSVAGPPQPVLERLECNKQQQQQLDCVVATQPLDKNLDTDADHNQAGLTQVVVGSTQKQQLEDRPAHGMLVSSQTQAGPRAEVVASVVAAGSAQKKQVSPARKQQSQRHRVAGSKRRREKNAAKRERKATKTLAIVLGIFLICWTPFFTCNIIDGVCIQLDMDCRPGMMVYTITSWLGYINSCVNPIIYTIFNMEFRRAFKKIICIRSK